MDSEAREILRNVLTEYRRRPYQQLCNQITASPDRRTAAGASGAEYQIVIQVMWDSGPNEDVRVLDLIDDGACVFLPLADDFIKTPDGSFVGEPYEPEALVGKTIIVGTTHRGHTEEVKDQNQYFGKIVRVTPQEGIVIQLKSGDERYLPPDLRGIHRAPPAACNED